MNESSLEDKKNRLSWILSLEGLEGIGRISTRKVVKAFPTYSTLLNMPYEQAFIRLKGVANRENLIRKLKDRAFFEPVLAAVYDHVSRLFEMRVDVVSWDTPTWPVRLEAIEGNPKPNILYGYGNIALLNQPLIGLFGRPNLEANHFELAQDVVRFLLQEDLTLMTGLETGFDTVVHKICSTSGRPSVMWASSGLARISNNIRSQAMASVRQGGVMVSSFPMQHGLYKHDEFERAKLVAAAAQVCLFTQPEARTPEYHALELAVQLNKPVFGIMHQEIEGVQPIASEDDFPSIQAALKI
ncbi:MAG TPA: DNA-processing protein DprA [Rhodothermales bacterium]|nr:DNA-processing protein DprA [Rhodothermales bacterium]